MTTKYNIVINEAQRILLADTLKVMLDQQRHVQFVQPNGRADVDDLRFMLISLVDDEGEDPGAQHDFTV